MSKPKMQWMPTGISRRHFLRTSAMGAAALCMPRVVWAGGKKILKVRDYSPVESFDPAIHSGTPELVAQETIYNKLMSFKPGDVWEIMPEAAVGIEQVDKTHIKFQLKPGLKFTNGYGDLTAEDVKFSMERHLDPKLKSQLKGDLGPLDHVEVTGKLSGVIIHKEPFPPFTSISMPQMSGLIISKKATMEKGGTFTEPPCSSGPYKFGEWKPKERTVLVRNEEWGGKPADFDEIHILVIDDEKTAEMGFEAGDLDFTRISTSSLANYLAKPVPNTTLVTKPSLYYVWMGMNQDNEILKNPKVRQAIQYAVDVDAVLEAAYFGAAKRATGLIPPGLMGHRAANLIAKQDLAKAKELLAEAGYPNGLELHLAVLNKSTWVTAAQVIQASLAQIGIKLEIDVHESGTFWALGDASKGEDWKKLQLILNRFNSLPDPYYATQWFTKDQIGVWNWERFADEEFNQLHQKAAVELDPAKRDQMYQKMQDLMEQSGDYVFLTHEASPILYRNTIVPAMRPDGIPMLRYFKNA